jgi:YVTN family beta-propeller protein
MNEQHAMRVPHRRSRAVHRRGGAFALAIAVAAAAFGLVASSADIKVGNQPASEGRPITPAGSLVPDLTTRLPAVGSLPVAFARSPDRAGPDNRGRYLVAVNSGYGVQFDSVKNKAQQSLAVIDLDAKPSPAVVQNVYFPAPQSANVGAVFSPRAGTDGSFALYVSGGFENKVWTFRLSPGAGVPLSPASSGPDTKVEAPAIDVNGFAADAPGPRYNSNHAPVYPAGLAVSADGDTLFVANNLGDSLGVVHDVHSVPRLERIELAGQKVKVEERAGRGVEAVAGVEAGRVVEAGARAAEHFVYPYAIVALPPSHAGADAIKDARTTDGASSSVDASPSSGASPSGDTSVSDGASKVYVSCWNDASIAVVNFSGGSRYIKYVSVERHPTAMTLSADASRLYVVNSNADSVSVIDTKTDQEVERISVRLAESAPAGSSPEGLALGEDGRTLYVANAHSNSVAVVQLSDAARGTRSADAARESSRSKGVREVSGRGGPGNSSRRVESGRSKVRGFIPVGQYPSAIAVAGGTVYVGNGKGTGFANSSMVVDNSGRAPNSPNASFPAGTGRGSGQGGQYSVSLVAGNLSAVPEPDERALAGYTQAVMRNNGLVGAARRELFGGRSPIKHIIYVIKENRTYDQVFGDLAASGDGTRADGDSSLAIFGAGETARTRRGAAQNITPNERALALRFGLFDRFFVNAEASPDGHNWSTAAFSTDYLDKAYRLNYSGRGRSYDFEGFNRLPNLGPQSGSPPLFGAGAGAEEIAGYMRRFVPYLSGARDVTEPETLYLWDAAARAGLTYRNYGEFVATLSESDVASIAKNRAKSYPDITQTVSAFPTKKALEGRHSQTFRNFDLATPDAMTIDSYRAARESEDRAGVSKDQTNVLKDQAGISRDKTDVSKDQTNPLISPANPDVRLRGYSRIAAWLEEFRGFVAGREAGRADAMPNFSIMRLPNDHTNGVSAGRPTPQFYVADNDYALGRLVEAVSNSPYWRDTAIFVVEDDAQDGPDHVDCHRSVALVVSAYNRPGMLVHEYHNTVSLVRTMEMLLGLAPMNLLDATATPADLFRREPDLRPYKAALPEVSLDNLSTPNARDAASLYWMRRTAEQDIEHADMADPRTLNEAIWFSARGASSPMPESARLPAFDAMRLGLRAEAEGEENKSEERESDAARAELANHATRPKPRRKSD